MKKKWKPLTTITYFDSFKRKSSFAPFVLLFQLILNVTEYIQKVRNLTNLLVLNLNSIVFFNVLFARISLFLKNKKKKQKYKNIIKKTYLTNCLI